MYFHFVLVSVVAKSQIQKKKKKSQQEISTNFPIGREKTLPRKAPIAFTLTNSCVAECKAACSYNLYPAAAETSPSLKH